MALRMARLGDFVKVITGKLDANAANDNGKYPFFTCAREISRIDTYAYDSDAVLVAGNGDLNVKHYQGKFNAYQRTYIIESNDPNELDTRYLFLFMDRYVDTLRKQSIGGVIKYIKLGNLTDAPIPLPCIDEQRRIVAILDKADAIRRKREQALTLADDFLRSAFLEKFGDPVRNTKGIPTKPLKDICSIHRGRFTPRPRNDPAYYEGNHPFIQTGDISRSDGYLTAWTQTLNDKGTTVSRKFETGTVVIAIVGATIGETAILAQPTYFPDSVIGIVPFDDNATPEFIEYALRFWKPVFVARAPETARANINIETLKPLDFLMPPYGQQEGFSRLYQKIVTETKTRLSCDCKLFESLSQRAFKGEL